MSDAEENAAPRAEELIVTVLKNKQAMVEAGREPSKVVLTMTQYRILQDYRARLGDVPDSAFEYLTQYDLFGLEFYVESAGEKSDGEIRVE